MADDKGPVSAFIEKRGKKLLDEARKAQNEADALNVLAKHWPDSRTISQVYYSGTMRELGDIHITAVVETRADALDYLDAFALKPITYYSGNGISTIRVTDWTPKKTSERYDTEISDIYPMIWTFGDHAKPFMKAYTQYDDLRVAIKVSIRQDSAYRVKQREGSYDRDVLVGWRLVNAPGGTGIKFAGSLDAPGDVVMYFPQEPGSAAPDMRELLLEPHRATNIVWRRG